LRLFPFRHDVAPTEPAQRSQLLEFDNRNHFSGHWINLPDRRSGTLRAKELFISTLERGVASARASGLHFLRVRFFL
jgi:hypothetical protein